MGTIALAGHKCAYLMLFCPGKIDGHREQLGKQSSNVANVLFMLTKISVVHSLQGKSMAQSDITKGSIGEKER